MNDETKKVDIEQWYSTYGILTADRILSRYNIRLDHASLISAVKNPRSIYYQLLRVPLKNVYSGIIMQQAHDYQTYAQKLFVDYLISGQADKPEDSPGEAVRETLESERVNLKALNEQFEEENKIRYKLIAQSQETFIKHTKTMQQTLKTAAGQIKELSDTSASLSDIKTAIRAALAAFEGEAAHMLDNDSPFWVFISEKLSVEIHSDMITGLQSSMKAINDYRNVVEQDHEQYSERCDEVILTMRNSRKAFYDLILRVKEKISYLPEYRENEELTLEQMETLLFDSSIGESK
jgi:hypothetical protein